VQRAALEDTAVIMFVTRGVASRSHAPPEGMRPTIVIYVRPATTPAPELLRDGIAAITVTDSRWGHVNVKSLALQPNVLAKRRALRAGAAEAIFIRDGHVTDCTASNAFFVVRGQVRTPPESNYILSGITREAALDLCRQEGSRARRGRLTPTLPRVTSLTSPTSDHARGGSTPRHRRWQAGSGSRGGSPRRPDGRRGGLTPFEGRLHRHNRQGHTGTEFCSVPAYTLTSLPNSTQNMAHNTEPFKDAREWRAAQTTRRRLRGRGGARPRRRH
jgi:hypothetical protein